MPSLQQINTAQPSETPKQPKNAALKKYLKIIAGVAAIWLGYTYFTGAKVMTIPDDAYAMRDKSMFKELFESPYKKIIWFGADCPISRQKSSIINTVLQVTQLNKFYVHRPFLQNSLFVQPTAMITAPRKPMKVRMSDVIHLGCLSASQTRAFFSAALRKEVCILTDCSFAIIIL